MTPQESELILGVASRLASAGGAEKDPEADRLIQERIGSNKDALYLLTQAVIVQEHGLKHAQARIEQLDADLQALRQQEATANQSKHSSGFLGGLFGGGGGTAPAPPLRLRPMRRPRRDRTPS